jgi:hypothetical protein
MRKVATKMLARRIATHIGAPGIARIEHAQSAAGGRIRGRADVIRRSPKHEIEDYKSGAVFEGDSGELKRAYRMQMLLYAVLEHEESGSWPASASVIPLTGDPVVIEIAPAEAEAARDDALAALAHYNQCVEGTDDAGRLAAPGPEQCRFCEFAAVCPAFWRALNPGWRDGPVVAAAGHILAREASQRGLVALRIDVEAGSIDPGEWTIAGVDPARFPEAVRAEPGSLLAATAVLAADEVRALRPTERTRLAFSA